MKVKTSEPKSDSLPGSNICLWREHTTSSFPKASASDRVSPQWHFYSQVTGSHTGSQSLAFVWLTDVVAKIGCFSLKCPSLISSCEEDPVSWRELERELGQGPEEPGASHCQRAGLDGILGKNSSLGGWGGPGTGCPEQLWLPLDPWQCPRPGWSGLGAAWDKGRCPCPWQGWDWMGFKVPSNPNHSMILWLLLPSAFP